MRKSNRAVVLGVVAALTVLGIPSLSFADPYSVGDGWHSFSWTGTGGSQVESPFTFSSAGAVAVKVTDAYVSGDRFQLFDNGQLIGTTSQINGSAPWTDSPDVAFASSMFSNGIFALGAGAHSLTLTDIQSPTGYPGGSAFLRFDAVNTGGNGSVASVTTPEPGTLALVGLGLAGLAVRRARRRFRNNPEVAVA
jgi:hypothetical protein